MDIATFVQDTSQQLGGFTITTGISLGGLALVAVILLSIVSCILCCCVAARKAANTVAIPAPVYVFCIPFPTIHVFEHCSNIT